MSLNGRGGLNSRGVNNAAAFVLRTGRSINSGGVNAHTINGINGPPLNPAPPLVGEGFAEAPFEIVVTDVEGSGLTVLPFEIVVSGVGVASADFEIVVAQPSGPTIAPFEIEVFGIGAATAPTEIVVFDPADFLPSPGDTICWEAEVFLDGIDVSASLTGSLSVEAEENAARVASFILRPAMGVIELTDWVGADVLISFVRKHPVTQVVTSKIRMFSGVVDVPEYDPNTRLTSYACTDNLQQRVEQLPRETIDTLIGGRYSPFVFNAEEDNWTYTQDQQSTVPRAFDISPQGVFRPSTAWAAKVSPDFLFDESNIVDDSLSVALEDFREIVTELIIEFDYGFERLRERHLRWSWAYPGDFCDYAVHHHTIPRKDMIEQAMDGTSWTLLSVNFVDLPPSDIILGCPFAPNMFAWVNTESGFGPQFCLQANGLLAKRFGQSVREDYVLRILAPQIEAVFGAPVTETVTNSIRSEYDTDKWEDSLDTPTDVTLTQLLDPDTLLPSDDFFESRDGEPVASRADVDEAILTLIDQGKATVLSAHRQNFVEFTVPIVPTIDVIHTIEIDTDTLDARGKVSQVIHRLDVESGEAVSEVGLLVSKSNGDVVIETPTAVPPIPDTISQMSTTNGTLFLGSRYGGMISGTALTGQKIAQNASPPIDPENEDPPFLGYTGNRSPADAGSLVYDTTFNMNTTEIDDEDRDEIVGEETFDYDVAIPDELLVMSA